MRTHALPFAVLLLAGCRADGVTKYMTEDDYASDDTDTADTADTADSADTTDTTDTADTADTGEACTPEVCDGLDNDCDGAIDEADATDAPVWYGDADADGYGAGLAVAACTAPESSTDNPDDCDDNDATVHPGAEVACSSADANCDGAPDDVDADGDHFLGCEECNDTDATAFPGGSEACDGVDDDCDGTIDEDASDMHRWYTDGDTDGYGAGAATLSCDAPADGVANAADCDDADAAVFPGATELCNGIDDDCDGDIDQDAVDTTTYYIDYDSDGYGNAAWTDGGCSQPAGYVTNADDCDDTDDLVSPAGTELCNGYDDDCDSLVDEPDALDATTWYEDLDGDLWGNAAVYDVQCEAPTAWVDVDGDCDDTDATAYPGAVERFDGADDDCDGSVDEFTWIGTGADGALDVTGTTTLGDAWAVAAISGADVTLIDMVSLAVGDEVLIINMHGSDAAHSRVGTYEFGWVAAVSGADVTLETAVVETYGEVDNTDLLDQAIQLVRVPQYTDVGVAAGGVLTALPWDGETGGVLAFRASGTVSVADGGMISVDELGYAGGATGSYYNADGYQGESYAGVGDGGLDSSSGFYGNWAAGYYLANYGGGGALITGGGGNYAGGATNGDGWDDGTYGGYPESVAGDVYGTAALTTLFPGSGGAGVWRGLSSPGPGGDGAGIVYIGASAIDVAGAAGVSAVGGTTPYWATGAWTYGAGGGAGGSVWLVADTLTLAMAAVDASGGFGESTHIRVGGDGGEGRIRLDYNAVNGASYGGGSDAAAADDASEPDAAWRAAP